MIGSSRVFEEMITWGNDDWPRIDRSWFENSRLNRGGFDEKLFEALGIEDDSGVPAKLRLMLPQAYSERWRRPYSRLAGDAKNGVSGGWTWP